MRTTRLLLPVHFFKTLNPSSNEVKSPLLFSQAVDIVGNVTCPKAVSVPTTVKIVTRNSAENNLIFLILIHPLSTFNTYMVAHQLQKVCLNL